MNHNDAFEGAIVDGLEITFTLEPANYTPVKWLQSKIEDTGAEFEMSVEEYTHTRTGFTFSNIKKE
jgi:hypothetical protein